MMNMIRIGCQQTCRLFLGALLLLLTACTTSNDPLSPFSSPQGSGYGQADKLGQLSLFLNLKEKNGPELKMRILSIEVLGEDMRWLPLLFEPVEADSRVILGGQISLARSFLAPGYYSQLRMTTNQSLQSAETVPDPVVTTLEIRQPLYVAKGDSHSLFLTWDVNASLAVADKDRPSLNLAPKLKNLLVDVAYVACPDINTVYMICTDKNWVCDSLGVSGDPSYLVSDQTNPTGNLFVLTEEDSNIKQIGPAANRVEETYYLSMIGKPQHMAISPDGQWAYVVDQNRGNILRINLQSGSIETRKRLGYEPSYILYLEKQGLLAVALSLSQSVVLLDPETLTQVQTISTGSRPEGLMLYNDTYLYIAESAGNSVMVYDLSLNRMQRRIPVDLSPMRILAADGLIYVTNYTSHSISVLKHGQLGVSKTISLDGPPLELAYSTSNKWVYVGNELTKTLDIIDPVNSKVVGRIPLGAPPKGMAVLQ
ncbi:MAG: YncE family protein [Proteobacteria bacterium]|nr:YncE family protein [Pseudomonadota bacterium]